MAVTRRQPVFSTSIAVERWTALASQTGVSTVSLGDLGWYRLDLGNMGGKLNELFLPAELANAEQIIAFPGFPAGNPVDFWRYIVHPHTRLRVSASQYRLQLAVELAAAVDADYMFRITDTHFSGKSRDQNDMLVISADDPVAARLVWLCAQQFLSEDVDDETINPWEDEQIQAAAELGVGVQISSELRLCIHSATILAVSFAKFSANKLGCHLIWMH
jgi:hypothetical protein